MNVDCCDALRGAANLLETLLGWSLPIYSVMAVRRVFAKSWAGALVKTGALSFVYLAVFTLTAAGVFFYALLQL